MAHLSALLAQILRRFFHSNTMTLQSLTMHNGTLPQLRWMWLITTTTFQPCFSRDALVLLWVTFNAIEAVCHCTSSNFGASWWCCGRSVVKSVQEELTSEPFWDLFIEREPSFWLLVNIFACASNQTLLLTLFGLVSGCIETETLSHHRETCFFWSSVSLILQRRQLDHEMYVSKELSGGCGDQNGRWDVCWCWLNQKIEWTSMWVRCKVECLMSSERHLSSCGWTRWKVVNDDV